MSDHDMGDVLRIERTFLDADDVASDPDTVVLTVEAPSGTQTTLNVVNDTEAVGRFYADVTPDEPGRWYYRWDTTGDPTVRETGHFWVRRDRIVVP